jgi:hypothetical protein
MNNLHLNRSIVFNREKIEQNYRKTIYSFQINEIKILLRIITYLT